VRRHARYAVLVSLLEGRSNMEFAGDTSGDTATIRWNVGREQASRGSSSSLLDMAENWEEELTGEDYLIGYATRDAYGVPLNIMGHRSEEFFSALGRIVSLTATLENKILGFLQYLVGRSQQAHTELSVGRLIDMALKELHRLPPDDREFAEEFLGEAKAITTKRNDYVHNMWTAKGDGSYYGWRVPTKKDAKPVDMLVTMNEMRADLGRLVVLLETKRLHRFQGLVSGGQHLRP
jgi:hypothetical protein